MPDLPGGTLTVLHTDVEGSTPLTMRLGDRYPEVLATHCALVRGAFAAHGGHEVDTQGDSFFVVFTRATQAVAAAVAIQRALTTEAWPEGVTTPPSGCSISRSTGVTMRVAPRKPGRRSAAGAAVGVARAMA